MSQQDKEIETEATQQAHYIQWGLIMGILDPCGHQKGYQRIVAINIKYLMSGVNFRNKDFLRLATIQGLVTSINSLFRLQSMEAPVDTSDPTKWQASSSTTLSRKRISQDSVARWTATSLPSCCKSRTYLVCRIRNSTPYLTSLPSVATLILV
jgi:hypothetical protein